MNCLLKVVPAVCLFLLSFYLTSAQEKVCSKKAPLYYMFEQVDVQEPEDATFREQYGKIPILKSKALELLQGNPLFQVIPFSDYRKVKSQQGYLMIATLYYDKGKKDYRFTLGLLTLCGIASQIWRRLFKCIRPGIRNTRPAGRLQDYLKK